MSDNTCATCIWWHQNGAPLSAASRKVAPNDSLGTCQVRPPQIAPSPHFATGMFPETHASRFCSEWIDEAGPDGDGGERVVDRVGIVPQLRSVA